MTAASIFHSRVTASNGFNRISVKNKENFVALIAPPRVIDYEFSSLELVRNKYGMTYPGYDWTAIAEIKIHPHYKSNNEEYAHKAQFDVAMIKLKTRDAFKTT